MIEVVEVGNNDRNRKCDGQHAGNGTQGPYYFSPHTYWPVWLNNKKIGCQMILIKKIDNAFINTASRARKTHHPGKEQRLKKGVNQPLFSLA